jgi:hypothetical protein
LAVDVSFRSRGIHGGDEPDGVVAGSDDEVDGLAGDGVEALIFSVEAPIAPTIGGIVWCR